MITKVFERVFTSRVPSRARIIKLRKIMLLKGAGGRSLKYHVQSIQNNNAAIHEKRAQVCKNQYKEIL
jgi:hypothetical protein